MTSEVVEVLNNDEIGDVPTMKSTPVVFTVILSVLTLGIYLPYWFISRRKSLNELDSEGSISFITPLCLLIIYAFTALTFVPAYFFFNDWTLVLHNYLDILVTYLGITITLYLSFQVKSILNRNREFSSVATFFFHIWYLQYRINRECRKEN